MVNAIERGSARPNTSSLIVPINKAAILMCEDAEPLPSMFRNWHAADAKTKPCRSNRRPCFPPFIVALVMLAFAPAQAALLTSSSPINAKEALEETVVLVKQGAAGIASLISMQPAAKQETYSTGDMD
jgi:hypothetical protein